MKRGQTISAEREKVESESERMLARKRQRRKNRTSVILVLMMLGVLGALAYTGARSVVEGAQQLPVLEGDKYDVLAEIVDETGRGQLSARMKQYIGRVEQDFRDEGRKVTRITLPAGTSRELYVDVADEVGYYKISMERDAAVSVEDAIRMRKYLQERGIEVEYIDVRVEGKGYYKAKS